MLGGVRTLVEFLDHFPIEGRDIVRLAAGHQASIDDHLAVHPVPPAFLISVFSDGQDVRVLPLTTPASTRSQGP
jgi:hypothetical protein